MVLMSVGGIPRRIPSMCPVALPHPRVRSPPSRQMLYPFSWHHVLIPILPPSLSDYVAAPMPYVVCTHVCLCWMRVRMV